MPTPLVAVQLAAAGPKIWCKLEFLNPSGSTKDRIAVGTRVAAGDHIGHPSCEGGLATGTHVHITRKYNGEWVAAGGPVPFVMSGWTAHAGPAEYKGTLTKGDQSIIANTASTHESQITRKPGE